MTGWIETYRGAVRPWECDVMEHFTVAYYFDRFADATLALLETLGMGFSYHEATRHGCATADGFVRYLRELRVGDVHHVESVPIAIDQKGLKVGHRVIDSANGELVTTMEQYLIHFDMDRRKSAPIPPEIADAVRSRLVEWGYPEREERPEPEGDAGFLDTYRDSTKPWEVDAIGHIGFQFYIERFSAAGQHLMTAFGMSPEYMQSQRRGFSTFEFQIRFLRELHAGELVLVRSGLAHLGNSSMRVIHKLYNARTGNPSAVLSQFGVHLDLDARRPTPFPDALRQRAQDILVKV